MKLTSALVLSFVASAQAATSHSSMILPSGVPAYVAFPLCLLPFKPNQNKNTHVQRRIDQAVRYPLSSHSESTSLQSVFSSLSTANPTGTPSGITISTPTSTITITPTVTSPSSSGSSSSTTSAQATTTSSAAGRTEVGLGLGLAGGVAAGLLGFFF
ncbi:hypothetical protein DFJ58DRAFT_395964 [Suillus subalutaceus]|uniref:uncharacterized protein n=1 Tax=Suillus subalutaceus TaxID=48586 RepID=UPI001B85FC8E|nr:uncharacterized protein DFJ58DRAFT_395964 [Suillus subalutaceus]KAG1853145.1 hypothetical protein DFJ58DRAFT_395964 [Suillus subalutaceus]